LEPYLNDPNLGIKALLAKDIDALSQQQAKLQADLMGYRKAQEAVTQQVKMKVADVEAIFAEAELLRGDIYRLQNLVTEAETDRFRAIEHQEKLRDAWERYQGVIDRLKQRNEILRQQVQQKQRLKYEDPPTGI
jgi:chromosome segregation ATPase